MEKQGAPGEGRFTGAAVEYGNFMTLSNAKPFPSTSLLLAAVLFLALLPGFSLPAVLPLIEQDWGMRPSHSGVVMAAFQAGYILSAVVALPLTDRVDARRVVLTGAVLTTTSHILFALAGRDPVSGTILRALAGAGLGCIYMPGLRVVSLTKELRGRAVGAYVSAYLFGTAASFMATGALVLWMNWQQAYLLVAALCGLSVPVGVYLALRPAGAAVRPVRRDQPEPGPPLPWRAALRANLPVMLMIGAYVAHMWELYGARTWMSPFLAHALGGGSERATSLAAGITSVSILLSAAAVPFSGWSSDRRGRILTASGIMLVSGACSFGFGWLLGAPAWLLVFVVALYSVVVVVDSPIFSTGVTELADRERLGRIMAWQTFLGYTAASLSSIVFGIILEYADPALSWGLAFSSLGLVALLGPLMLLVLSRLPEKKLLCGGKG